MASRSTLICVFTQVSTFAFSWTSYLPGVTKIFWYQYRDSGACINCQAAIAASGVQVFAWSPARNAHIMRRLSVSLLAAVLLLLVLVGALVSCQANAADALPRLLAVLPMPSPLGEGTAKGVIHPNGRVYIANEAGSIAILDGTRLVALLPWPGGKPVAWLLVGMDVDVSSGNVYVTDSRANAIHIINDTQIITTVQNVGIEPTHLVVHPRTGLVYVASPRGDERLPAPGTVTVISGTAVITTVVVGYTAGNRRCKCFG